MSELVFLVKPSDVVTDLYLFIFVHFMNMFGADTKENIFVIKVSL
ncbi:hypothetical protein JCM19241_149 [Vibrio ishigakensis]|uniref:Uncharacterized protein n=1 Tax=Vibrio ishigakensis TaxID=1481914 RepID=A0A0B8QB40_9VIBR|nr:hypothetical protein JCM19241_149 [Vibrio ishigakensis]